MPSRRHVPAGGGFALAGLAGGVRFLDGPISVSSVSGTEWPMVRYDPTGTGYNPESRGPKDGVEIVWQRDTGSSVRGLTAPILVGETLYAVGQQSLVAPVHAVAIVSLFEHRHDGWAGTPIEP